ncbi:hypothetical protein EDC17_101941 [Sphingobacterium alimentarium]|uniref:Uncharacterized protein n=1 Tax=Sphingobacterium alimentarium TaxID=797292 RepID=A0A4R3VXN1_9SPHI|nr:hypothetical protein [Sphingobacterium alimentarium]TCV13685.1 hypothetical protein EDC17_101941 [Sphingobacterium alimentarium]
MKIKRFYFKPHFEALVISIDGGIANHSACVTPTDPYDNIYESWEDDPDVNKTIDW